MNSQCGVQSKRKCESHESCICIAGFSACGCQKKSVVYEMESLDMQRSTGKAGPEQFITLKHMQSALYLIRYEMGSQCSLFFKQRCQENEPCSRFQFLGEKLDDRIRCTHEETVAVVKP